MSAKDNPDLRGKGGYSGMVTHGGVALVVGIADIGTAKLHY
ncbi:MAG: hypothetical protein ACYTXF_34500 [Nostoc sp.]